METHIFVAIFAIAFASVSTLTASEEDAKPSPRLFQAQSETVDLGKVYDYFTSDANANRFQTSVIFQAIFNAVGYILGTLFWTWFRGDALPTPPASNTSTVTAILDGVFADQNAAIVVALAIGYAISASIVYIFLSQLGNPSTLSSNSRGKSSGYYDENIDRVTSVDDIFSLIDGVFTPARATGFFTLQAILNFSILLFWQVMRLLPDRNAAGVRLQDGEQASNQFYGDQLTSNQYDYQYYGDFSARNYKDLSY